MTRYRLFRATLVVAFLGLHGSVSASAYEYPEREGRFIDRHAEGWFFYEEPLQERKPQKQEKKPEPKPQDAVQTMQVPMPAPTPMPAQPAAATPPPGPALLSAAWLRANTQRYKDAAFENPTPENVAALLYLQKYMLDQISKGTKSMEVAILNNPDLDETSRFPNSTGYAKELGFNAKRNHYKLVDELSKTHGLWVFYRSNDFLAKDFFTMLANLRKHHGYELYLISLDGGAPPIDGFTFRVDQGQSKVLGVQNAPAIFLVNDQAEFAPVAQSFVSEDVILERIVLTAMQTGWITQDQYMQTQLAQFYDQQQMDRLNKRLGTYLEKNPIKPENTTNFIPPKDLIQLVISSSSGDAS